MSKKKKKQIALEKKQFAELETQFQEIKALCWKLYNEQEDARKNQWGLGLGSFKGLTLKKNRSNWFYYIL